MYISAIERNAELKQMESRISRIICIAACVCLLAGCNPETMVKEKTPGWLKSVLTFSAAGGTGSGSSGGTRPAVLQLISPKNGETFPSGESIEFAAEAYDETGKAPGPREVTWRIFEGGQGPAQKLGDGLVVSRKFMPGDYRAEVTMVRPGAKNLKKQVSFSVAQSLSGRVVHNNEGLEGIQILLLEADSRALTSQAVSGRDGTFSIVIPMQGKFRLQAEKPGFSFSPLEHIVQYEPGLPTMMFSAARAEIHRLKLTESPDSGDAVVSICPQQDIYLKAEIKSEAVVSRLQAFLVPANNTAGKELVIGEAVDASQVPNSLNQSSAQSLPVKIPDIYAQQAIGKQYLLRVTAYDNLGNAFAGQAPEIISVNAKRCFAKWFQKGVAEQEQGSHEAAVEQYDLVEEVYKSMGDEAYGLIEYVAKALFNRGISGIEMSKALKAGELKRVGYLGKAVLDFKEVIGLSKRDSQAYLLLGYANTLKNSYEPAERAYSDATAIDPLMAKAYELRAITRIRLAETGARERQLTRAIDDFTEALTLEPGDKALRESRKKALLASLEPENDELYQELVKSMPKETLDVKSFIRK